MDRKETRFLAAAPGETTAALRRGLPLAHLCYRLGPGPHLFRSNSPVTPQGGLMVIDDAGFRGEGEAEPFCGEVARECALRRFSGVFCRFRGRGQPTLNRICTRLGQICADRGLSLFLSEGYAADRGAVVIPSAVSGGSLGERLREAGERYGRDRVAVWVDRTAEDFPMPSPTGSGNRLTGEELVRLREERGSSVFFSPQLCARYFTYMAGQTGHFVLFDDASSVRRKLELCRELSVGTVFLPYGELEDLLGEILA